jgi:hypothetical protein
MVAVAWAAIGLLAMAPRTFAAAFFQLSGRIDQLGARIDARLDALSTRLDAHL